MKKIPMALDDLLKGKRGKQDAAPGYPDRIGGGNRLIRLMERPVFIAILALVYFSIPFVVHWRHLLAGELLVSGDGMTKMNYMLYVGESIKNGDFPLWTPYLAGGMPFAEDVALDVMYPPLWLCSLLPRVAQLYAYFGLHYALGGVAMFSYLKRIKCSPFVSFAVSTMYLFTIHMGGARKEHVSLIVAALYVPVILYFLERYLQERKLRWLLCGSAAMALQFYGGFLQYVVYTDIFAFFYLLCSGIRRRFSLKTMLYHGTLWVAAYFGMAMACVLPMAQMLGMMANTGGSKMPLELFGILSLHPLKLIMMIFPYFFGENVFSGMYTPGNYSSGMDIELFLGCAAAAAIIAGFTLIRKNQYVRFMTAAVAVTLLYACMAQFPLLQEMLYRIPLLNMFRVPSRTLFLFTFSCLVILACSLNELSASDKQIKCFKAAGCFVAVVMIAAAVAYSSIDAAEAEEKLSFQQVFLTPTVVFIAVAAVFSAVVILRREGRLGTRAAANIVTAVIVLSSVVQMMPFYIYTWYQSEADVWDLPPEITENTGTEKILSGYSTGVFTENESLVMELPSLNSYTNFNLPELYKLMWHTDAAPMNSSGLYVFSSDMVKQSIRQDGEILSLLGVKYAFVPAESEPDSIIPIDEYVVDEVLVDEQTPDVVQSETMKYIVLPVTLESYSYYRISMNVVASEGTGSVNADFYALDYDAAEQEAWFNLTAGSNTCETIFPSLRVPGDGSVLFRIMVWEESDIQISDVRVEKITPQKSDDYALVIEEDSFDVYENRNAKPLVYAPERVEPISEEEKTDLYLYTDKYDILNTAYITGGTQAYDFSGADVQISDIELKNNQVSAKVEASSAAFVNMSQTYYPGWRAYVDGKRTELWEVNGIIQGTFVPAGEHTVEFVYRPAAFFAGLFISIATAGACGAAVLMEGRGAQRNRKERRNCR